jgi:hypothetical protein
MAMIEMWGGCGLVEDLSMSSVEIEKVTWFDIFRILSYFKRTWQIPLECSTTQQKKHRQRAKRKVTTKLMSISGPAAFGKPSRYRLKCGAAASRDVRRPSKKADRCHHYRITEASKGPTFIGRV